MAIDQRVSHLERSWRCAAMGLLLVVVGIVAVGIPCCDSAGHVVDFHSLRHTYVSCIVYSRASVKVAQELARHSTATSQR